MTEFDELVQEYGQGKLDPIKKDLESFIKKNDLEIQRFIQKVNSKLYYKISVDQGIRWYLTLSQSINLATESKAQIEEIQREIWYRREEHSQKPVEEIAIDWIKKHAAGWRNHRALQIVYVYSQEKEKYLKLLESP